jgi:hypothetical protein
VVLVSTPFGPDWYPYLMRRIAERPANVLFFAKNLVRPCRTSRHLADPAPEGAIRDASPSR